MYKSGTRARVPRAGVRQQLARICRPSFDHVACLCGSYSVAHAVAHAAAIQEPDDAVQWQGQAHLPRRWRLERDDVRRVPERRGE